MIVMIDQRGSTGVQVFVPNMSRVRAAAYHPRGKAPHTYIVFRKGEQSADDEVYDADEKRREKPCFTR